MPFGEVTTLYLPVPASAGTSQWGLDVRKVLTVADAGVDRTSTLVHGTGGVTVRTVDPYTASSTDAVQADYGWAIAPTDMGSTAGARRFYPAGNHVANLVLLAAVGQNGTVFAYVYRVGPSPTRTRTLIGSGSAAHNGNGAEAATTITIALPEVVFGADETIQWSFETSFSGIAVLGHTPTFSTGTTPSLGSPRITTPALGTLAPGVGSASGTASASGAGGTVIGTAGSSAGTSTATGTGASRADSTGTAAGSATATGAGASVSGTVGAAAGSSTVAGQASRVLGTVGTAEVSSGGGTIVNVFRPFIFMSDE